MPKIALGAPPSGRSTTTTSYWRFIPIRTGDITARRVTAFGLGGITNVAEAAGHLEQCLKRRPRNPMLQGTARSLPVEAQSES